MKLTNLKQKLEKVNNQRKNSIRYKYKEEYNNIVKHKNLNEVKIIGITGSRGKSTIAYLVHEYLKKQGYKSVLYSSIKIDSPASFINPNEGCEIALKDSEGLLNIIEEVQYYGADYLVLEINESSLEKGIIDDLEFYVKVLTNLNSKHNLEFYQEADYLTLKKAFFKENNKKCKYVIGLQDYEKELFEELLTLNDNQKITFSSKYIANTKGINLNQFNYLLTDLDNSINGLKLIVEEKEHNKFYNLETNLLCSYNALNIVDVMAILKVLDKFDITKYQEFIKEVKVPGRTEVTKANKRTIIIDPHLPSILENLQQFQTKGEINKIKVVIGSIGTGFKTWSNRYQQKAYLQERSKTRKYAMDLLKNKVDYVYLTESDNAKDSVLDICKELQNYLENEVASEIIENREEAIKRAINESQENDVILISGRGNRRILCASIDKVKLVKDSEVVEKVLEELKW